MTDHNGDLSQNQDGPVLAEAYSYASPLLGPLNHELTAAKPALKLHITSRAAMATGLSQNAALVAPTQIFSLLKAKPFRPAAPVGLAYLGSSPGCYFAVRDANPRLSAYIQARLKWLKATFEAKAKHQLTSPRDAMSWLWQRASENDPSDELKGMKPRLIPGSASSDHRDLATAFYHLLFGPKAASEQQIIEAARVQPVAGPGEVAIEFHWHDLSGGQPAQPSVMLELGEIWQAITNLPFVMSVWQCQEPVAAPIAQRLMQAAQLAEAKMKIDPAAYFNDGQAPIGRNLAALWQRTRYLLGEDDFLSLQLLGQLLQLFRHRSDHDFYLRSSQWSDELASQQSPTTS